MRCSVTRERILSSSVAEWLFIRPRTSLEFEADPTHDGVQLLSTGAAEGRWNPIDE